jgi:hypothetical protein
VLEGWLEKQPFGLEVGGKSKRGAFSQWQRRYFVLKSDGTLYYFKSHEDSVNWSAEQYVDFNNVTAVEDAEIGKGKLRGKKHVDEIKQKQLQFICDGRPCLLKAETQEEKANWMQTLLLWVRREHPMQREAQVESVAGVPGGDAEEGIPPEGGEAVGGVGDLPTGGGISGLIPGEEVARGQEVGQETGGEEAELTALAAAAVVVAVDTEEVATLKAVKAEKAREALLFATELVSTLHCLNKEAGHDAKKSREAYHQLLLCIKALILQPTNPQRWPFLVPGKKTHTDFHSRLGKYLSGLHILEMLGFTEKRYARSDGTDIIDIVLVFTPGYPNMEHLAWVWFVMLRACGDVGMSDKDLVSRGSLLSFPPSVSVPSSRPYPLGLDVSPDLKLDSFLLKRSGLGALATTKKVRACVRACVRAGIVCGAYRGATVA